MKSDFRTVSFGDLRRPATRSKEPFYITENGCACSEADLKADLNDVMRLEYYWTHLGACRQPLPQVSTCEDILPDP